MRVLREGWWGWAGGIDCCSAHPAGTRQRAKGRRGGWVGGDRDRGGPQQIEGGRKEEEAYRALGSACEVEGRQWAGCVGRYISCHSYAAFLVMTQKGGRLCCWRVRCVWCWCWGQSTFRRGPAAGKRDLQTVRGERAQASLSRQAAVACAALFFFDRKGERKARAEEKRAGGEGQCARRAPLLWQGREEGEKNGVRASQRRRQNPPCASLDQRKVTGSVSARRRRPITALWESCGVQGERGKKGGAGSEGRGRREREEEGAGESQAAAAGHVGPGPPDSDRREGGG